MEITGNQLIPKAQQQTWNAICDPAVLQICIPGCDSMEKISDSEFQMTMSESGTWVMKWSGDDGYQATAQAKIEVQ